MCYAKIGGRGISARKARQIRLGIATGELIYNFVVKEDIDAARLALIKASRTPKRVYKATLQTLARRMGCTPDQFML